MATKVTEYLQQKTKANTQKAVFPEAMEEKMPCADRQVKDESIASPWKKSSEL